MVKTSVVQLSTFKPNLWISIKDIYNARNNMYKKIFNFIFLPLNNLLLIFETKNRYAQRFCISISNFVVSGIFLQPSLPEQKQGCA